MDMNAEAAVAIFYLDDENINSVEIPYESEYMDNINAALPLNEMVEISSKDTEEMNNGFIDNSSLFSNAIYALQAENKSTLIAEDNLDYKDKDIYLLTSDNKSFLCKSCEIKISKKDVEKHFMFHKKTPMNDNFEIKLVCLICKNKFLKLNEFDMHFLIHKLYQCNYCMKKFTQKTSLNYHQRIHTDEKPFACPLCDKKFRIKSYLKIHSRIHFGQRPFKCKFCYKTFTQKSTLDNHLPIHTGEKPFECELCNKRFSLKFYLETHLKSHLNQIEVFNEYIM